MQPPAGQAQPAPTATPTPTPTPRAVLLAAETTPTLARSPAAAAPGAGAQAGSTLPGRAGSTPQDPAAGRAAGSRVDVCGTLAGDTTWTPGPVYVVTCDVTVPAGRTLHIEPGTVVKFAPPRFSAMELVVDGRLEAAGTAAAPVVFTSLADDTAGGDTNGDGTATRGEPGQWSAITFRAGSQGRLTHAAIRYGGGWYFHYGTKALVRVFGGDVVLDRVTLEGSAVYGLYAESPVSVVNSRIRDHGSPGLFFDLRQGGSAVLEIAGNVFSGGAGEMTFNRAATAAPVPVTLRDNRIEGRPGGFSVRGLLRGALTWDNGPAFPMIVSANLEVAPTGLLRIAPGSAVKLAFGRTDGGELFVNGRLEAAGTAAAPIVFTSLTDDTAGGDTNGDGAATRGEPGQWSAITFGAGSQGRLTHAAIRYGGGWYYHYDSKALVRVFGEDVVLEHVTLTQSGGHGVYAENGPALLRNCTVTDTARHGVYNQTPQQAVDARRVWWGDATGPHHPRKNPGGRGDQVTDGVLFFPWAVDADGTVPSRVLVEGPARVSPGETVDVGIRYFAGTQLAGALLVASLPWDAELLGATGGGVPWPERHQVFWRLGDIGPGEGAVAVRLRYEFGLPDGSGDGVLAHLVAENLPSPDFDPGEYARYRPGTGGAQRVLTAAELGAELAASPALRALYDRAVAEGFVAPRATRTATGAGEDLVEILLLRPERGAARLIGRVGAAVAGVEYDRDGFRVFDARGGLSWDAALDRFATWGAWNGPSARSAAGTISFARCFFNCVAPKLSLAVVKKTIKTVGLAFKIDNCIACGLSRGTNIEACAKCANAVKPLVTVEIRGEQVPILGELIDVTKCAADCAGQQGVVFPCRTDLFTCDSSVTRSVWTRVFQQCTYRRVPCEDGILVPERSYVVNSGSFTDQAKCVEGKGCVPCGSGAASGAAVCDLRRPTVQTARDPNEKRVSRPAALAGDELEYRIEYENVGAGSAFDVFVLDQVPPELDEASLVLDAGARFFPATRTLLWSIGTLAPKGQPGATGFRTFRVRARPDLPDGTVIANTAVVHFPSVPEETETNAAVTVIEPIVALPAALETAAGVPVDIELRGRAPGDPPLTFAIVAEPGAGTLTGTPPRLRYAPAVNFTGPDRFSFRVSDGTRASRAADVVVHVRPGQADAIPPAVLWTSPEAGSVVSDPPAQPAFTDGDGPAFLPLLRAGMSEALAPESVTAASVWLAGPGGPVPATVGWDAAEQTIVVVPRAAWVAGTYAVSIDTGVRDASGNPLAEPFTWRFRVAAGGCPGDCNGDGEVTIDELIQGVNIALGTAPLAQCPSFDVDGDGGVTVDELIRAVNHALGGCG